MSTPSSGARSTTDSPVLVEFSDTMPPLLVDDENSHIAATTTTTTTTTTILPPAAAAATSSTRADSTHTTTDPTTTTTTPALLEQQQQQQQPHAVCIVSVGDKSNEYAFVYHAAAMANILRQISPTNEVAVVSVVGAFRTGKSFLLSWFLQYLAFHQTTRTTTKTKSTDTTSTNSTTKNQKWYETFRTLGTQDGFSWRGGSDRNTTGIWMWSEPFYLPVDNDDDDDDKRMAVLLVDTQGMFDHETTMSLTASIFGLSTLLSSYQIYNVDKQIQEDNLQQLALFSEYARKAIRNDDMDAAEQQRHEHHDVAMRRTRDNVVVTTTTTTTTSDEDKQENQQDTTATSEVEAKPFQVIEFLVRDWQHFDEEEDLQAMEQEMNAYLEKAIATKSAKDLRDTREQITSCFETISCFGLTHPGAAVTKKKYEGTVADVDHLFLKLLDKYCQRVFSSANLQPKKIHGRALTAAELGVYVAAYAQLFTDGARFPEASTMLEATEKANNMAALQVAVSEYQATMDRLAGPLCSDYWEPVRLEQQHSMRMTAALAKFDAMADFGSRTRILTARQELVRQVTEKFDGYKSWNESRNPLAGLETYILPFGMGLVSYVVRFSLDLTCTSSWQMCRAGSDLFSHVYAVVWFFLFIVGVTKFQQIRLFVMKLYKAWRLLVQDFSNSSAADNNKTTKSD